MSQTKNTTFRSEKSIYISKTFRAKLQKQKNNSDECKSDVAKKLTELKL